MLAEAARVRLHPMSRSLDCRLILSELTHYRTDLYKLIRNYFIIVKRGGGKWRNLLNISFDIKLKYGLREMRKNADIIINYLRRISRCLFYTAHFIRLTLYDWVLRKSFYASIIEEHFEAMNMDGILMLELASSFAT